MGAAGIEPPTSTVCSGDSFDDRCQELILFEFRWDAFFAPAATVCRCVTPDCHRICPAILLVMGKRRIRLLPARIRSPLSQPSSQEGQRLKVINSSRRLPENQLNVIAAAGWIGVLYLCWVIGQDSWERTMFSFGAMAGAVEQQGRHL